MTDLWNERVLPILRDLALCDDTGEELGLEATAQELGITTEQIGAEIDRLKEAGYIAAEVHRSMGGSVFRVTSTRVLERGVRELELWPSDDPYAALLAVLDARMEALPEASEEQTKLKALRAILVDVGKGTATGILLALARNAGGF